MSDFVLQEPQQEQPKEDKGKHLILYQENICYLPHHFGKQKLKV